MLGASSTMRVGDALELFSTADVGDAETEGGWVFGSSTPHYKNIKVQTKRRRVTIK